MKESQAAEERGPGQANVVAIVEIKHRDTRPVLLRVETDTPKRMDLQAANLDTANLDLRAANLGGVRLQYAFLQGAQDPALLEIHEALGIEAERHLVLHKAAERRLRTGGGTG